MQTNGAVLDVNGVIIASPGGNDVSAAVDRAAAEAGGHVTVTRSGGFFLEAAPSDAGGGGLLSLVCGDEQKGQRQFATAPVTRAEATALLCDFIGGGDAWRRQCKWRSRNSTIPAPPAAWSRSSLAAWLAVGGAIVATLMVSITPALLPAAFGIALGMFVVRKAWRERQVRRWPRIDGRITASGVQPRRRRFMREATTVDNIPALSYEFSVLGRRYVGSRLGLNTEYAGVDVGALIARYPVGAVIAVHYNPTDPNDCLLDPDANRGLLGEALKLVAIVGIFAIALYYGERAFTHALAARFPNANAPHAAAAASAGLFLLMLFIWSFRPQPSTAAALRVPGKIVKSEVEEVSLGVVGPADYVFAGGGTYWQPTIEVAYSVGGYSYVLRTAVGGGISVRTRGWGKRLGLERILGARSVDAQAQLAPYPVGKTVNVLYGPSNPGAATLETSGRGLAMVGDPTVTRYYRVGVLVCAFGCFAMASLALGVF